MKIWHAYCKELNETVTIDEARRYFVSENPPLENYSFFCTDEHCDSVRITGVNFRKLANEVDGKFISAHFRMLDAHHPECMWQKFEQNIEKGSSTEASNVEAKQKHLRMKLHDFVTAFDPRTNAEIQPLKSNNLFSVDTKVENNGTTRNNRGNEANKHRQNIDGIVRTNQLERLVNTYLEAKELLTDEQFKEMSIHIVGGETIPISDYFTQIKFALTAPKQNVLYGGATLVKRYGNGFSFKFYDKIDNKPVSLYVDSETMSAYRFKSYIEKILQAQSRIKYFKLFAIGSIISTKEGTLNLVVQDLRHLSIVLGPEIT